MFLRADKVMFEIYREASYAARYHVVYYTDLDEQQRDREVNRALAGDHFTSGFISNHRKEEAKQIIAAFVARLNEAEPLQTAQLAEALAGFLAPV
ncbi:MAG: hypothetical protein HYY96_14935 [Candidatus Tectomicrobia bacterium]|nr:hypothetical protein [Candidatus Tectomicrobia bacterium]